MRRLAKIRGYDENKWFGNVEYIAAEKISAETVTYVNNIYKILHCLSAIDGAHGRKKKIQGALDLKP